MHYFSFVNHALRDYVLHQPRPAAFTTSAMQKNWIACDHVIAKRNTMEQNIIFSVYSGIEEGIVSSVRSAAIKFQISEDEVWELLRDVAHIIAKERGLI